MSGQKPPGLPISLASMFACCDESGTHPDSRWWALGALWLPEDALLPGYAAEVTRLRQRYNAWGEFKWGKLTCERLEEYQALLEITLALPDLRFTSMVVDSNLITREQLKERHDGKRDLVYLKCMRLLLKHRIKHWVQEGHTSYTVLYDKQSVSKALARQFRDVMRSDMRQLAAQGCSYRFLAPVNSAGSTLLQATDLLVGAMHHAWEDEPGGKNEAAREALREQIEDWTGEPLTNEGQWGAEKYSNWRWAPGQGASSAASGGAPGAWP